MHLTAIQLTSAVIKTHKIFAKKCDISPGCTLYARKGLWSLLGYYPSIYEKKQRKTKSLNLDTKCLGRDTKNYIQFRNVTRSRLFVKSAKCGSDTCGKRG